VQTGHDGASIPTRHHSQSNLLFFPFSRGGKLKIGSLQTLVMDEFDALLEYKPHRDPTRAIMQSLKRRHGDALQSVLCSATATDVMDSANVVDFLRPGYETALADEGDVLVTDGSRNTKEGGGGGAVQVSRTVLHGVVHLQHRRLALDAVRKILHTEPIPQQILIFVENARKVDIVVEKLADRGIIAAPLHGGMGSDKSDRAEVSKALREGYVGIVVATELAARGLDAPLLTHVINLDLPTDASHYAHRAGRCGRGGRPGVVINFTTQPKERNVPRRFADDLGVEMFTIEPRGGKLLMIDPASQTIDAPLA
jgi:superfamily II DNA/RNA helicase